MSACIAPRNSGGVVVISTEDEDGYLDDLWIDANQIEQLCVKLMELKVVAERMNERTKMYQADLAALQAEYSDLF